MAELGATGKGEQATLDGPDLYLRLTPSTTPRSTPSSHPPFSLGPEPSSSRPCAPPLTASRASTCAGSPPISSAGATATGDRFRATAGGKAIRTLAVLSAQAVGGAPEAGIPGAVAVELVHNFSLLHDDVMDRDVERRHRPTGWVAFGEGQAILAGNAMLTRAIEVLIETEPGRRSLPGLLDAVQLLIGGQSRDLLLEQAATVQLPEVLEMEAGKTAALLACASSIGAVAAGASGELVAGLTAFGHELGMAFQLVDDILGVVGDPARTGKSSSSDVRAGKRSAPIVAALAAPAPAATQLLSCSPPAHRRPRRTSHARPSSSSTQAGSSGPPTRPTRRLAAALGQLEPAAAERGRGAELAPWLLHREPGP